MSDSPKVAAGSESLRFFGAVGASLSHEINNVLAIINELSGLMGDFLVAAESGRPLDQERLKNSVERIAKQVGRGKGYIKALNQFSHAMDNPRASLDSRESFEQIVSVCQRFYTLKKVSLDSTLPDSPLVLEGSPFDLQHLIYRCLDAALQASGSGQCIEIRLQPDSDGARIVLTGQDACEITEEVTSRLDLLLGLTELLGGSAEITAQPGSPLALALVLPRRLGSLAFSAPPDQEE